MIVLCAPRWTSRVGLEWFWRRALVRPQLWALFAVAFVPLALYDAFVSAHAEWHWASGITAKHVLPELVAAFTSPAAFWRKLVQFSDAFAMLRKLGHALVHFLSVAEETPHHRDPASR